MAEDYTDRKKLKKNHRARVKISTSGDAKPKYSQSHVPPAKLKVRRKQRDNIMNTGVIKQR